MMLLTIFAIVASAEAIYYPYPGEITPFGQSVGFRCGVPNENKTSTTNKYINEFIGEANVGLYFGCGEIPEGLEFINCEYSVIRNADGFVISVLYGNDDSFISSVVCQVKNAFAIDLGRQYYPDPKQVYVKDRQFDGLTYQLSYFGVRDSDGAAVIGMTSWKFPDVKTSSPLTGAPVYTSAPIPTQIPTEDHTILIVSVISGAAITIILISFFIYNHRNRSARDVIPLLI